MSNTSYNWLRPNSFRLVIKELPSVSFTCQRANLPTLSASSANQPTPFKDIPRIGDKLYNDDFRVSFIVDEVMSNYLEIYRWMVGINFPEDYSQFNDMLQNRGSIQGISNDKEAIAYSDLTLSVLDSNNNAKIEVVYKDAFPILLSPADFDIKDDSVQYLTCDVAFKFSMFDIKVL